MDASKVMMLIVILPHCDGECNQKPHHTPIIMHCINALIDKGNYNEFNIIHNKIITLYLFYKSLVLSYNNSPKCMLKIYTESIFFKQPQCEAN